MDPRAEYKKLKETQADINRKSFLMKNSPIKKKGFDENED